MAASSTAHVPLLSTADDSDDDDVERGVLPSYAQATSAATSVDGGGGLSKIFLSSRPPMRDGKEPVALADAAIRLGACRVFKAK